MNFKEIHDSLIAKSADDPETSYEHVIPVRAPFDKEGYYRPKLSAADLEKRNIELVASVYARSAKKNLGPIMPGLSFPIAYTLRAAIITAFLRQSSPTRLQKIFGAKEGIVYEELEKGRWNLLQVNFRAQAFNYPLIETTIYWPRDDEDAIPWWVLKNYDTKTETETETAVITTGLGSPAIPEYYKDALAQNGLVI